MYTVMDSSGGKVWWVVLDSSVYSDGLQWGEGTEDPHSLWRVVLDSSVHSDGGGVCVQL